MDFFDGRRSTPTSPINYRETRRFSKTIGPELTVTSSIFATGSAVVGRGSERTNPNIQILGIDGNYLNVANIPLEKRQGLYNS